MTRADYDRYDLLIGMDSANIRNMLRICGGDPEEKIHRLLDYTACPGDVADPWYTGDFRPPGGMCWRAAPQYCTDTPPANNADLSSGLKWYTKNDSISYCFTTNLPFI